MKRMIAVALSALIPLIAGCDGDDAGELFVGPRIQEAANLRVLIVGPRLVSAPGSYEWTALVHGAEGAIEYRWVLGHGDASGESLLSEEPVLRLTLAEAPPPELHITLTVRSGDRIVTTSQIVAVCGGEQPVDWCRPLAVEEPDPRRARAFAGALVAAG